MNGNGAGAFASVGAVIMLLDHAPPIPSYWEPVRNPFTAVPTSAPPPARPGVNPVNRIA
jgi:hypothetical protein